MRTMRAVVLASILLVSCAKKNPMPDIQDGVKLQQDCARLFNQYKGGGIPAQQWPSSIKDLKPISVIRQGNCIEIIVFQERGKGSWGYEVFPNEQASPSTQGVWIQKTAFKGVYVFKRWF